MFVRRAFVAIDLGATSGRPMLGRLERIETAPGTFAQAASACHLCTND